MSVCLLNAAAAAATGVAAPINGLTGRVTAVGGFAGGDITVEVSPAPSGSDWIALATTLGDDESLEIAQPWARIRAKSHASQTGTSTVYFNPFPLSF